LIRSDKRRSDIRTRNAYYRIPTAAHDGAEGLRRNGIRASSGVRLPLRWLHGPHAATVLDQVFLPPRELGSTWSMVVACPPQYAHSCRSRSNPPRRDQPGPLENRHLVTT